MTKVDAILSRSHSSGKFPVQGPALIHVTWDSSPDLEQFMAFIAAYTKGRFSSSLAERLTLASNELLDNAARYGSLARDLSYELSLMGGQPWISVRNTTMPSRIEMLTAQLKRLDSGPEQVYVSELERSLGPSSGRRSMLGLARIRHEAEMRIELSLEANDVTVRAHSAR